MDLAHFFGIAAVLAHCKSKMTSRLNPCELEHAILCFLLDYTVERIDGHKDTGCGLTGC